MPSWYQRRREAKLLEKTRKGFALDYKHSPYWCECHWAPYRTANSEGIYPNGRMAAALVTQEYVASAEYQSLPDKSPNAVRAHMEAERIPLCCRLGDEMMGRIYETAIQYGTKTTTSEHDRETPP